MSQNDKDNLGSIFGDWLNGKPTFTFDDFFQRVPPVDKQPITVAQLVARGTSHVKQNGKIYKIVVTEYQG